MVVRQNAIKVRRTAFANGCKADELGFYASEIFCTVWITHEVHEAISELTETRVISAFSLAL